MSIDRSIESEWSIDIHEHAGATDHINVINPHGAKTSPCQNHDRQQQRQEQTTDIYIRSLMLLDRSIVSYGRSPFHRHTTTTTTKRVSWNCRTLSRLSDSSASARPHSVCDRALCGQHVVATCAAWIASIMYEWPAWWWCKPPPPPSFKRRPWRSRRHKSPKLSTSPSYASILLHFSNLLAIVNDATACSGRCNLKSNCPR